MELITTILAFLLAVGILIVIHELGHYAVARACGVKVLRFSVGFGRPLLRWVRGADRTEWVDLRRAATAATSRCSTSANRTACRSARPTARAPSTARASARRSAIVAAGPVANLLLAIFFYWLIGVIGTLEPPAILAAPAAGTVAQEAGVRDGDRVLDVDGRAVRSWSELRWALIQAGLAQRDAPLGVRRLDGSAARLVLDLSAGTGGEIDEAWFDHLGIARGLGPAIIRGVVAGEVADRAGLAVGDRIVAIDGVPVATGSELTGRVRASAGRAQEWQVERAGRMERHRLTPAALTLDDGRTIGRVGIDFNDLQTVRYGPVAALGHAVDRTWDTTVFSLRMVGRMIVGEASWRNLSGPVTTAEVAGRTARMGLVAYLSFLALVSISIGVFNLLPIPVLDGGHLLYYAVEVVKGSPPSVRAVEVAQRVGVGMLVLLTALALFNDLTRLLS